MALPFLSDLQKENAELKRELAELKREFNRLVGENHFLRKENERIVADWHVAPAHPVRRKPGGRAMSSR